MDKKLKDINLGTIWESMLNIASQIEKMNESLVLIVENLKYLNKQVAQDSNKVPNVAAAYAK